MSGTPVPSWQLFLSAVPMDDKWFRITSEFTVHALRDPALRRVVVAREEAITATLLPVVENMLTRVGPVITDAEALGRALVAVHDGTAVQCLLEPDNAAVHEYRVDLFLRVRAAYTEQAPAG